MQTTFVKPEVPARPINSEAKTRRMTYQVTMCGHDGTVMASDQREYLSPQSPSQGEGAVTNLIPKIKIDPTRRFAWAFAGGKPSYLAAGYLEREFENGVADSDLERTMRTCGDLGWDEGNDGPSDSTVILADGKSKNILRANLAHRSQVYKIVGGKCFTGQNYSKASFFPMRFHSPKMSVTQLASLAAFAVVMAGELDRLMVDGLDFADSRDYYQQAMKLDGDIRRLFV
jgi:hypothetical protein